MTIRSTILGLCLCLAAAACTSDEEEETAEQPNASTVEIATPLESAVAAWSEVATDNYLVRAIDNDRTSLDAGCTWITEVHGARVDIRSTAMFDVECGDWDVSVPALHQQLIDYRIEVDQNGGQLEVEWNERGVPSQIDFAPADGEGMSLTIEFQNLDDRSLVRVDLAAARSRWSAASIGDYQLELAEFTNYWSRGCRWTTVVTDGLPTQTSVDPDSNSYCFEVEWTVEVLFEMVSGWADTIDEFSDPAFGEHTLIATFDENGVPRTLTYDLANGSDEESSLQITFNQP